MRFSGVRLPAITPFAHGEIDYRAYERLVDHYVKIGVTGVIPLGTTGESPTIDEEETERIVERTVAVVAGRVPIVVGVSGNDTRKAVKAVKRLPRHSIQGGSQSAPTTTDQARTACASTSGASRRRPIGRS